ncbi:MAG: alpha/beta hydrolase [Burkholderiales bacterium]|nr:MAG: alpha/beta hydrolase [Burkholderiales bacterium]
MELPMTAGTELDLLDIVEQGQGPPLLLLHGIQGTSRSWRKVTDRLDGFTCVMPNWPGRSRSPRASGPAAAVIYHVDHFASLAHALILKLAARTGGPVDVAGWSMGVTVLLRVWELHGPPPIRRLALLSGTPVPARAAWFSGDSLQAVALEAEARARALGLDSVADPDAVARSWLSVRTLDQRGILPLVRCPVMVIHGDADRQSPPCDGRLLAETLPDARWQELAAAGHAILEEVPDQVAQSLKNFFRQTPG